MDSGQVLKEIFVKFTLKLVAFYSSRVSCFLDKNGSSKVLSMG